MKHQPLDSIESIMTNINQHEITSKEVIEAYYEVIASMEPTIKAFAYLRDKEEVIDEIIKRTDKRDEPLPLLGLSYAVKDNIHINGVPTEAGSNLLKGFISDRTATIVERLNAAGASMLGKTTMAEFASGGGAPKTTNPHNPAHTPGGSSTGSAAAVAAGMLSFSIGTQTSGSVIRPAAYCGITALKPTFGQISRSGIIPASWSMDCVGIFANRVSDLKYIYNVIAGYDEKDTITYPYKEKTLTLNQGNPSKLFKIGIITDDYFIGTDEVMRAFNQALDLLKIHRHTLIEVSMPASFIQANKAHGVIVDAETAAYHSTYYQEKKSLFSSVLRQDIENGRSYSALDYLKAQNTRWDYIHEMKGLFETVDLLITPATTEVAPLGLEKTGSPIFNKPFSNAGLPVLTLPIGISKHTGLPIGIQVIANDDCEQHLIDIGEGLQGNTDSLNTQLSLI